MTATPGADRRATARTYDAHLPAFYPLKLTGPFISVDFVVAGALEAAAPGPGRLPARQALHHAGGALDTRVTPRRMLAWLRSMPSYRAGVPLRIGHGTDGLAFRKSAELIELLDPGRSVVYLTGTPFTPEERAFFAAPRHTLLLELTATPRGAAPGAARDPLELVASAAGLDPRGLHWVVGPLAADGEAEALRILEALPPGSRLTLRPRPGVPGTGREAQAAALARLEAAAHARGHAVSEFSCRSGPARVGRGFFDVDRLTGQADLARRAHDLITCAACPSRTQCHGALEEGPLLARLARELRVLGLTPTAPPVRTGPRAYRLEVAEPSARGDEVYLSHAIAPPVAITLASRERGAREGGGDFDVVPAVLRRWYATGFLPVTELNAAAERVLDDLRRRQAARAAGS